MADVALKVTHKDLKNAIRDLVSEMMDKDALDKVVADAVDEKLSRFQKSLSEETTRKLALVRKIEIERHVATALEKEPQWQDRISRTIREIVKQRVSDEVKSAVDAAIPKSVSVKIEVNK